MTRVALLFTNFGPYHLARLDSFQKICNQQSWTTVGIELSRFEAKYPWRTQLGTFADTIISLNADEELEHLSIYKIIRKLLITLDQVDADVLAISGYSHPAMLVSLVWSLLNRKLAILFSDTKENDALRYP